MGHRLEQQARAYCKAKELDPEEWVHHTNTQGYVDSRGQIIHKR